MKGLKFTSILFFIVLIFNCNHQNSFAENASNRNGYVRLIDKLSWLSGGWKGEKWGGTIEEYWSEPEDGNMIGMFRFIRDGRIQFTELMYIQEKDQTLLFRLKHFDKDFKGWEDKDNPIDFPLIEMKDNDTIFDGLTYQLMPDRKLKATLFIKDDKTGEEKKEEFIYSKINASQ